jgi:hypothetical protein
MRGASCPPERRGDRAVVRIPAGNAYYGDLEEALLTLRPLVYDATVRLIELELGPLLGGALDGEFVARLRQVLTAHGKGLLLHARLAS